MPLEKRGGREVGRWHMKRCNFSISSVEKKLFSTLCLVDAGDVKSKSKFSFFFHSVNSAWENGCQNVRRKEERISSICK
jgi:hypothetical protein